MTPIFIIFYPTGALFMHHHNLIDPLFIAGKIGISLSHLVSEILVW